MTPPTSRSPSPEDRPKPTTTGYAVLGLLTLGDWSAYELAGLMARSVGLILPRAPSVIYEEPKRLVRWGLASSTVVARGRRDVAIYAITPAGRAALQGWLGEPSATPQLDAEAIVKTVFAGSGDLEQLRATVRQLRVDAEVRFDAILEQNAGYLDGDGGPFPERLPLIALAGRFPYLYLKFLVEWARWAEEVVAAWTAGPDGSIDTTDLHGWAVETLRQIAADGAAFRGSSS